MTVSAKPRTRPALLAAAIAALFATPALAQDDDVLRLVRPESSVEIGAGWLHRDAPRFGLYNGIDERGGYFLFDGTYVRRDNATGTWTVISAENLGLDSRRARAEWERQGNFGLFVEYDQVTRKDPNTILTGLQGIGGGDLAVSAGDLRDVKLELERRIVKLGFEKHFSRAFSGAIVFRNEEKEGSRIFGRGTPGAMEFLADPHSYSTRQLDATLSYASERFQLHGGYYGTSFDNDFTALHVAGGAAGLSGGAAPFTPIGLPPDNESHQFHLSGGWNLTRGTRASFKLAKGKAEQDDEFILAPASVVDRANLGGRVDTTLAQAQVASRVAPRVSVNALVRHEDRDDKTPLAQYFTGVTPTSTSNGFNEPRSIETTYGKVEGLFDVAAGWRLAARWEYDLKERNTSPVRVVTHRPETEENLFTFEVRRSMGEGVTGYVSYQRGERDGSDFDLTVLNNGAPGSNLVAPLLLANRERDKVRAMLDFSPTEAVSLQVVLEESRDDYGGRALGPKEGKQGHVGMDAGYRVNDDWRANAWFGFDRTRMEQDTQVSAPTGQLWKAKLAMRGKGYGAGVEGRMGRVAVRADLSHFDNESSFEQVALTGDLLPPIPNIEYRQTTVTLSARVPLGRDSGVRFLYIHDRWHADDWTWANFTYSDGTRVLQEPRQKANFVGVAYTLAFR